MKKLFTLLFILITLTIACQKENSSNTPTTTAPATTTCSDCNFEMDFSGKKITGKSDFTITSTKSFMFDMLDKDHCYQFIIYINDSTDIAQGRSYIIGGYSTNQNFSTTKKTYVSIGTFAVVCGGQGFGSDKRSESGSTFTITKFDKTSSTISATFSFTAYDPLNNAIPITGSLTNVH